MRKVSSWYRFKKFLGDDSLSIVLFALFLACLAGQGLSGWRAYDDALRAGHFPEMGLGAYLSTGTFLDGIFSNWQAAILQLAVLIAFSSVLRQKGAAHSRKGPGPSHRKLTRKLGTRDTLPEFLMANSLSLAFIGLFVATFLLHGLFGEWKHNEQQALRHLPPSSFETYLGSAGFWFSVFQCWEAEFVAIGLYILLSIFLRQEDSSESKPVGASNAQTGGANE